jgi:hypothetical protein
MKIIKYGVLALVIIGIGSCAWLFAGLAKDASAMREPTAQLVRTAFSDGLPEASEWSPKAGVSQDQLAQLEGFIRALGEPPADVEFDCGASARSDSTDRPDGRFVSCEKDIAYANRTMTTKIVWSKEDEEWKLMGYFINPPGAGEPAS